MSIETCKFEYDPAASTSNRIVTICRHCGTAKITEAPSQTDMWTQPAQELRHVPTDFLNRLVN